MISVVICSADAAKFACVSAMYQQALDGAAYELVHIPDAAGLCEGYNRGLQRSRGDVVLFSHDDVSIHCARLADRITAHLQHCDLFGVAGTTRLCHGNWWQSGPPTLYGQLLHYNAPKQRYDATVFGAPTRRVDRIQALDGVLLCCRRELAESVSFDDQTFTGFHMYDVDFSFRAFCMGYRLAVCNDLDVVHASRGTHDASYGQAVELFNAKHRLALQPLTMRRFMCNEVVCATLEDGLEVLRPPHWNDRAI